MKNYIAACGLAQYIDTANIHSKQIRHDTSYDVNELDIVLKMFLEENKITINSKFPKGTSNRKAKLFNRRITYSSQNFNKFKKWIHKKKY